MPTLSSESAAVSSRKAEGPPLAGHKRRGFGQGGKKPDFRGRHQVAHVAPDYTCVDALESVITPGPVPDSPGWRCGCLDSESMDVASRLYYFFFFAIFLFCDFGSWCWVKGCFLLREICQCLGAFFDEYELEGCY